MNLDLIRARMILYGSAPFNDHRLFLARQRFVAAVGIDEHTIFAAVHILTVVPVWFDADRFDLEEISGVESEIAVVCEVLDLDGESVVDLIAWRLERPSQIATFTGQTAMLGFDQLLRHDGCTKQPLKIYRTVPDWLRSYAIGEPAIVPLKVRATARALIDVDGEFETEDDRHGLELHAAVASLVHAGRFVVRVSQREAA